MLFNLNDFKKERHYLIMEKEDVMTVLEIISLAGREYRFDVAESMAVGNCGWGGDQTNKWFIHFDCRNNKWKTIIKKLNEVDKHLMMHDDEKLYVH